MTHGPPITHRPSDEPLSEARERAYRGVSQIQFEGMQFRTDIAARAAEEER